MRRLPILLTVLACTSPAFAGVRAVYSLPDDLSYVRGRTGGKSQIEVADNGDVRITYPDESYSLLLGDILYRIEKRNGAWRASRAADYSVAMAHVLMSYPAKIFPLTDSAGRWRTGRKIVKRGEARVNGRTGIIYAIKPWRCVVSNDPALAPLGRAMAREKAANLATSKITSAETAADMAALMRIYEQGAILECGQYRLLHAETAAIDPKRFALPAKPKTVDQLIEELQVEYPLPPHAPREER